MTVVGVAAVEVGIWSVAGRFFVVRLRVGVREDEDKDNDQDKDKD